MLNSVKLSSWDRWNNLPITFGYDFMSGTLDSSLTFSRGSAATMVNSSGQLVWAPMNLLNRSQAFNNAYWTLERGTLSADTDPFGGNNAFLLTEDTTASNNHHIFSSNVAKGATTLTFTASVYAKTNGRRLDMRLVNGPQTSSADGVFDLAGGQIGVAPTVSGSFTSPSASIQSIGNGWYRCSITFTSDTNGNVALFLQLDSGTGTGSTSTSYTGDGVSGVYLYGAQLELNSVNSPQAYKVTAGSAYYGPRFDYDPNTLALNGLLIEEGRTNYALQSGDVSNATWVKTGGTVTANATTAPDGKLTAGLLTEDTSTGGHQISQGTFALASDATRVSSFFVKANGRTAIRMESSANVGGSGIRAFFYLTGAGSTSGNFAIGSPLGVLVGASITQLQNGWYYCTATWTPGSTGNTTCSLSVSLVSTGTTVSYTGDGVSGAYIWGLQCEIGSFATSYIPTLTVSSTRAIETLTNTSIGSWFNASQGSVILECSIENSVANPTNAFTFSLSDGTASNRIEAFIGLGSFVINARYVAATVTTNPTIVPSVNFGSVNKVGMVYAVGANATNVFLNGTAGTASSPAASPTGINALGLGTPTQGSAAPLNGWVRKFSYYNTALTTAQLQTLTT